MWRKRTAKRAEHADASTETGEVLRSSTSSGEYKTLTLEFTKAPNILSLADRRCRAAVLEALADCSADRIVIEHGSKAVYEGAVARGLSELASIIKASRPDVCANCAKELGNIWEDPLIYYYRARSRRCSRCRDELARIGQAMHKSAFLKEAVALGASKYVWDLPAISVPAFFAAEVVDIGGKKLESYSVEDVNVTIKTHPKRLETLISLDYPELRLSAAELSILMSAYDKVSEKIPGKMRDIDVTFEAACKAALDDAIAAKGEGDKTKLLAILMRHTTGFGAIEPLLKDANLQDVFIDSRSLLVHTVHSKWGECVTNIHMTQTGLDKLATRLRALSGRPLDASSPVLHAEIESLGVRAAGICSPSTYHGTGFAFRRRKQSPWTLPEFIQFGMMDATTAGLLSFLVDGQATLLVTGSRASGKTSLLTALMLEVPQNSRMIVIEDTPEIPVDVLQKNGYKIEHLKTEAWAKGFELSAEDALRTSLRLGESTLVLGEVRGTEAKTLFEAMRIGAAGNVVMGTIHGSGAYDTWDRVVNDLGVPSNSFKAVDAMVTVGSIRFGDDVHRHRRLISVTEVRKGWKNEPSVSDFADIARFVRSGNRWKCSFGRSHTIKKIADIKGITVAEALRNISYRARMKSDIVRLSKKIPDVTGASFVIDANTAYLRFAAESKNTAQAYRKWRVWLKSREAEKK